MAKTARQRQPIPALPDDLFLWEILIRLPATTLLRCREVCRSWRRLTSYADFLLAHHRRQPSLPLVTIDGDQVQSRTVEAFDFRKSPAERRPVLRFNNYYCRGNFEVCASCDGLLLLSLSKGRFSICNPVTRQWTKLPTSLTGVNVVGMYPHSSSGEYRVLYWRSIGRPQYYGDSVVYYVLTVGSSAEPRCIGLPAASPSVEQFNMVGVTYMGNRPSVLLRSCLHWGRWTLENQLMVFDTVAESFRYMRSPVTSYRWARSRLLEMDGVLGFSHLDAAESVVDLWVLDNYELEVWLLKYWIELPQVQLRRISKPNWYFRGLVVSDNGDVLVYFESNLHLFHCDCKGNLVQKFPLDRAISLPLGYWFKESLVRHTFFQRN